MALLLLALLEYQLVGEKQSACVGKDKDIWSEDKNDLGRAADMIACSMLKRFCSCSLCSSLLFDFVTSTKSRRVSGTYFIEEVVMSSQTGYTVLS